MIHPHSLNGICPKGQWEFSRLPQIALWRDNSHMQDDEKSPLARAVESRMRELNLGQKALALRAGLNETFVRDILKGKSKSPQTANLIKLAEALGLSATTLLNLPAAAEQIELVQKPDELVLLRAWRELPDSDHEMVLAFIRFRISLAENPPAAGEAV